MKMKIAIIISVIINILLTGLILVVLVTNKFDFILFKKASPSVCTGMYRIAEENGKEEEFKNQYGEWCLDMVKEK